MPTTATTNLHSAHDACPRDLPDRIVREKETRLLTGLCRSTRWRLTRAGLFPAPVQITDRLIGWRESELVHWIASRANKADAARAKEAL